ncbi:pectinesterase family protein [Pseudactinotalea sp.]|uniref:pectinesterase family protein n=1 Tax=Pseudactinotalea sp. TaxID=1926260 RepID=UPI003B3A0D28
MTLARVGDDADLVPSLSLALADPAVTEIVLASGTYVEHVVIALRAQPLEIRSETGRAADVLLTFGLSQGDRDRTGMEITQDCATLTVDADDVTISGITIENSFDKRLYPKKANQQALALRSRGDRVVVKDCYLKARQDTALLDSPGYASVSRVHVHDCVIEGDVDFVYGRATAVLQRCEIRSIGPGYVAAPSTARENPRGFLFLNCSLTADGGVPAGSVRLGRPWHPGGKADALGQAWFVGCDLGEHVATDAWSDMGGFGWREARFAEQGNRGLGAATGADRPQATEAPSAQDWLEGWHGWPARDGEIHVVGDSTASTYEATQAPREGWGQRLPDAVGRPVHNHAVSGASSRSFIERGILDHVLEQLQPHDLLLIQFGHNDTKEDERHTNLFREYAPMLRRYLLGARARGATPVLLTSIERRRFDEAGRAVSTHGGYPQQVRDLAVEEGVPLIDLTVQTRALWQQQGAEGSKDSFLWLQPGEYAGFPEGEQDDTHLSSAGARLVATLVADGLRAAGLIPVTRA